MNPADLTDAQLDAFLDEALSPEQMTAVEEALRDDAMLADRIASAVGRRDAGLHSLGAIWRRRRLTCPSREQLGSHLLGVLTTDAAKYLEFHLQVVNCRTCQASLADLRQQHGAGDQATGDRRKRYFQTSAGYLNTDK